jgi:hypothetical protein
MQLSLSAARMAALQLPKRGDISAPDSPSPGSKSPRDKCWTLLDFTTVTFAVVLVGFAVFFFCHFLVRPIAERLVL